MRDRFHRSGGSGVSFFAFQDIITAVTGILVIITVFLSLNIKEGAASPDPANDAAAPELKARLQELLEAIANRRQAAEAASDSSTAAPKTMEIEIAMLEKEAAELAAFVADRKPSPDSKPLPPLDAAIARDMALEQIDVRMLKAKIARLKAEEAKISDARAAAEAEVKRREAELLSEMQKKNRLLLIRDPSRTSKEPLIAVLDDKGVMLHQFDSASAEHFETLADFQGQVRKCSSLEHYFVFYNKPSGVSAIDDYLKAARDAGFEVGYDAVPEDFVLELETTKEAAK